MGNQTKQGLDYFSLSVDFLDDIKVRKIIRAYGAQSVAVLISLLSRIYRFDGYFIVWEPDVRFFIADQVGVKESLVQEVVLKAVDVGFFDANIFQDRNILTSHGIQKRFFDATSRRKCVSYDATLVSKLINVSNNAIDVYINPINDDRNQQSKVKESKVKDNIYIVEIVNYLNEITKSNYSPKTKKTISLINSRMNVGYSVEDFKKVIDNKSAEWKGTEWEKYLRPETLFGNKFDSYLNQSTSKTNNKNSYKTKFHNFEQRTDKYTEKDLEDVAARKRREHMQKMKEVE